MGAALLTDYINPKTYFFILPITLPTFEYTTKICDKGKAQRISQRAILLTGCQV